MWETGKHVKVINNFHEAIDDVTQKIKHMLVKKRLDYGEGNLKAFGELGILIRSYDKISRLKNLLYDKKTEPQNETVEDTWMDIAGYAILALMMREGTLDLPVEHGGEKVNGIDPRD